MSNLDIAMESTPHVAQLGKSLHSKDLAQQKEISKIIFKSEMHSLYFNWKKKKLEHLGIFWGLYNIIYLKI